MHISTVSYSILKGLGGLEMQNEPVPRVRLVPAAVWETCIHERYSHLCQFHPGLRRGYNSHQRPPRERLR
jgi:hypothetical protein